jgi:hypothetical protein
MFDTDGTISGLRSAALGDSDCTGGRRWLEALCAFPGRPQRDFALKESRGARQRIEEVHPFRQLRC